MSGYYPSYQNGPSGSINPDYPAAISKIQNLSSAELQELLSDESKCDELLKSLDQIKSLYSEKEMLMASNKSLAEYNLSQEPKIQESRSKLQERHREATREAEKVRTLKAEIDSNSGKTDPDTLLALLQAAGSEVEDESEKIVEDFMNKDMDIDSFLEMFMEKRKIAHIRRIKIDKMKELLEVSSTQTTPSRRAPNPPPGAAFYTPPSNNWTPSRPAPTPPSSNANLPYPLHPVGMPSTGF